LLFVGGGRLVADPSITVATYVWPSFDGPRGNQINATNRSMNWDENRVAEGNSLMSEPFDRATMSAVTCQQRQILLLPPTTNSEQLRPHTALAAFYFNSGFFNLSVYPNTS
jgi:hypothetical protein